MSNQHRSSPWERKTAAGCAVAVLGVGLFLVIRNQPISDPNLAVIMRTLLSLGVAVIGATVPGFLNIEWAAGKTVIRAGGALALFVLTYLYTPKVLPKVFVTNVTTNVKNYDSTTNIINQYPPNVTNINGTNVLTNILTNVVISGQTDAPAPVTTFPPTPVHAAENPSVPVLVPDKAHVSAYTPPTNPPDSDLTSPPKITLTAAPTNPVVSLTNPLQLTNVPIAMLTWSSSNATQVTLTGFGSVPFNGSTNVSPLQSTNYTITATSASGTNSASVTVYVPGAPQNLQVGPP